MLANLTCGPAITLTDLGDVEGVRQRGREDVALGQRVVDVGVLLHKRVGEVYPLNTKTVEPIPNARHTGQ